jgi:hypothetical protein
LLARGAPAASASPVPALTAAGTAAGTGRAPVRRNLSATPRPATTEAAAPAVAETVPAPAAQASAPAVSSEAAPEG